MLVNAALDDCSIVKLRAVVLDELHMVDDDHRGYLLELMATKLLSLDQDIQIIGMSATLSVSVEEFPRVYTGVNASRWGRYERAINKESVSSKSD